MIQPGRHPHLALALWVVFVWTLLLMPVPAEVPRLAPWLPLWLSLGGDKVIHVGLFAVLGWLLCRSLEETPLARRAVPFTVLALAAILAVATELSQIPVPSRQADPRDALADLGGALVGLVALGMVRRLRRQWASVRRLG